MLPLIQQELHARDAAQVRHLQDVVQQRGEVGPALPEVQANGVQWWARQLRRCLGVDLVVVPVTRGRGQVP